MELQQGYHREHWRRRPGGQDPTTPSIHLHWESQVGSRVGRRGRLVSYTFVLFGTALGAFLVLALIMLYATGAAVSG